jgi:N-acyl-D-aspartate/D-glutamate deacylase
LVLFAGATAVADFSLQDPTSPDAGPLDVILAGGMVFTGDGSAGQVTDVGIVGDRIVVVGNLKGKKAMLRADVSGLIVAPGFIDVDNPRSFEEDEIRGYFRLTEAERFVLHGVTTVLVTSDGAADLPPGFLSGDFERVSSAINFGLMPMGEAVRLLEAEIVSLVGESGEKTDLAVLAGAIRDRTRLPADRLGLEQRGRIQEGAFADITVFDPEWVTDFAISENPDKNTTGFWHVFVNGQAVLLNGKVTGDHPGRPLDLNRMR